MKLNKLSILGLALVTMFFSNCSKSDDDSTITTETEYKFDLGKSVNRAFKGIVVDENNNALSGVTIKMSGKVATTDANGVFTLSNVSVKERFAYLTAEKAGFVNGSRTLMPHADLNTLKIMMLHENLVKTIQTGEVSNVQLGNTTVQFDGAFSTEAGVAYTGAVKIYMNDLPSNDVNVFNKMPGTLFAIDSKGEYKGLETYGMVNVDLKGANNEKLQIASGHKAKITMAIAPNQYDTAPNTMALWNFDEVEGVWKEDGFSTRVGNNYVGEVSHFCWWNNDYAYTVATLKVTAKNESDNTPVQGVRCTITRLAGSTGDVLMELGVTGANGTLSVGVPRNEVLIFRAYDQYGSLVWEENLPASNLMTRNVTVLIPLQQRIKG